MYEELSRWMNFDACGGKCVVVEEYESWMDAIDKCDMFWIFCSCAFRCSGKIMMMLKMRGSPYNMQKS
jgi:hypothetical protein